MRYPRYSSRPLWRLRLFAAVGAAAIVAAGAAACGSDDPGAPAAPGSGAFGGAPTTPPGPSPVATAPATPAAPTTTVPAVKPLTCTKLRNAKLGSAAVPFNGYPDYLPLADGIWAGEDGNSVELQKCAIGDLNGDGRADGIASIVLSAGGTGHFYSMAVWRNSGGSAVFTALLDLGDRTPVESISVSGQRATVVYLTRADDEPMAMISIRRTSVFRLAGATLVEESHTDAPYTP